MRLFLLSLFLLSTCPLFSQYRFPEPTDTFRVEGSAWNYDLYYHDLRVRVTQDMKPLLWRVEDEHVERNFRRTIGKEILNLPLTFSGSLLISYPFIIRLAGGPWYPNLFLAGCGVFGASMALDYSASQSRLRAVQRYNYLVTHDTELSFFASPMGIGVTVTW